MSGGSYSGALTVFSSCGIVMMVLPSSVRVTTLCCMSRDLRCRPEKDSKPGASALSSRCETSAYLDAGAGFSKLLDDMYELVEGVREESVVEDSFELDLDIAMLVVKLNEEAARDIGRSFNPSMLCSPKPAFLLFSILVCFSSFSFSLFLLSAMRSLKDLIRRWSIVGTEDVRECPEIGLLDVVAARLRLTSCARSPLSMPSTRAGLFCSSGSRLLRIGDTGT